MTINDYPLVRQYLQDGFLDDPDCEEDVRQQLLDIKENQPELWDELDSEYCCCPPAVAEFTKEMLDTICFGGCHLCWQACMADNFAYFKSCFD